MLKAVGTYILLFISFSVFAEQSPERESEQALVKLNVSVDTQGIADAITDTNQKLHEIKDVLVRIAENKELTKEQAELITQTTDNINHLVSSSNSIVEGLPNAVSGAREELRTTGEVFFYDVKVYSVIILGIIAVILAIVLYCFYRFVILPMQQTVVGATSNISDMAASIDSTASSLEIVNKSQLALMERLERLEEGKSS
ncbi:hypothetical protein [Vibrio sp. HN007]|uniref:hypothetical protein n=1 Tax=Vibrio iocasae TaxID=3098914 RepID=UPI0035D4DECE